MKLPFYLFLLLALESCHTLRVDAFPPWQNGEELSKGDQGFELVRCDESAAESCVRVLVKRWDAAALYASFIVYDRVTGKYPLLDQDMSPEMGIATIEFNGGIADDVLRYSCSNKGPAFSQRFVIDKSKKHVIFVKVTDRVGKRKWDIDVNLERGNTAPDGMCQETLAH